MSRVDMVSAQWCFYFALCLAGVWYSTVSGFPQRKVCDLGSWPSRTHHVVLRWANPHVLQTVPLVRSSLPAAGLDAFSLTRLLVCKLAGYPKQ